MRRTHAVVPDRLAARACLAACLAALLLLSACGGIAEQNWQTAIQGSGAVEQLLRQGSYAQAKARWQSVDRVIHAAYPEVDRVDPALAGELWHEMAVVELGFLNGSWKQAADAAGRLPDLLRKSRAALAGAGGG